MAQRIDWYYHRNGWTSCKKAQGFLAPRKVTTKETVIANRTKLGEREALDLAGQVSRVVVAKGRKVVTFDMKKDPPERDELLAAIIGPTGNLRAPAIRKGKTLLVGFNEEAFEDVFG